MSWDGNRKFRLKRGLKKLLSGIGIMRSGGKELKAGNMEMTKSELNIITILRNMVIEINVFSK